MDRAYRGKDGSSHRFQKPSGPGGRQPGSLEFASRGTSRLRGVSFVPLPLSTSSSSLFFALFFVFFFRSSPSYWSSRRVRSRRRSADERAEERARVRPASMRRFRMNFVRVVELHSKGPGRFLSACPPSSLAAILLSSFSFLPLSHPSALSPASRSTWRYRVDEKANHACQFIIQFINHTLPLVSLCSPVSGGKLVTLTKFRLHDHSALVHRKLFQIIRGLLRSKNEPRERNVY